MADSRGAARSVTQAERSKRAGHGGSRAPRSSAATRLERKLQVHLARLLHDNIDKLGGDDDYVPNRLAGNETLNVRMCQRCIAEHLLEKIIWFVNISALF